MVLLCKASAVLYPDSDKREGTELIWLVMIPEFLMRIAILMHCFTAVSFWGGNFCFPNKHDLIDI